MNLLTSLFTAKLRTLEFFRKEVYELNKDIIDKDPKEQLRYAHLDGQIAALKECAQDAKRLDQLDSLVRKSKKKLFFLFAASAVLLTLINIVVMFEKGFNWDKMTVCIWAFAATLATYERRMFQKSEDDILIEEIEQQQEQP